MSMCMRRSSLEYIDRNTGAFYIMTERDGNSVTLKNTNTDETRDMTRAELTADYVPIGKAET